MKAEQVKHQRPLDPLSVAWLKCNQCGMPYSTLDELKRHRQRVHGLLTEKDDVIKTEPQAITTTSNEQFERHETGRDVDGDDVDVLFPCFMCDEEFSTVDELQLHCDESEH